jgi:Holliday junction resolvase RusA-like endonuclease
MTVTLTLPMPPSTNTLWKNVAGGGRRRTSGYNAWYEEAGWAVNRQKPGKIRGPYSVSIRVPAAMRADVDNAIKPIIDLLVKMGVTGDDKEMQAVSIRRDPDAKAVHLTVEAA